METTMLEHEVMDFQVEKILGECIHNLKPNACHFNMWKLMDNWWIEGTTNVGQCDDPISF